MGVGIIVVQILHSLRLSLGIILLRCTEFFTLLTAHTVPSLTMPISSFPVPPLRDAALQSQQDHVSNTYNIKSKQTTAAQRALFNRH